MVLLFCNTCGVRALLLQAGSYVEIHSSSFLCQYKRLIQYSTYLTDTKSVIKVYALGFIYTAALQVQRFLCKMLHCIFNFILFKKRFKYGKTWDNARRRASHSILSNHFKPIALNDCFTIHFTKQGLVICVLFCNVSLIFVF